MQLGGERGEFPLNTSMVRNMESELSSSLTSTQLVGGPRDIAYAFADLALFYKRGMCVHWDIF